MTTTIGTVGSSWRASVTAWGAVQPADGPVLDWWVAADDRWHVPSREPSVRQRRLGGAPVVETALRVPKGDALQRVYAVADAGGLIVVEVENDSPLPFAVAFSHGELLTSRPPSSVTPQGLDLPAGAIVLPVGHRSVVRVALAADGRRRGQRGQLPADLPTPAQVASGWRAQTSTGVRIEGLDELDDALVAARAALLLEGAPGEPVGWLLGSAELARLGSGRPDAVDVAEAAMDVARAHKRAPVWPWDAVAAVDAAAELLERLGEERGANDARAMATGVKGREELPAERPTEPARFVAWVVRRLVRPFARGVHVLPEPLPAWRGRNVAVYGAPAPGGTVSFAVRWHGPRPALLWETKSAVASVALDAPALAPSWSTTAASGETLLV